MEHLEIDRTDSGFHSSGFLDANRVIKLSGHKARRLSELASHRNDLQIALASLEGINVVPPDNSLLRQSLWRSAIQHWVKCFSDSSARSRLDEKKVFKGNSVALELYDYFKKLRNKHIAHDENPYMQCIPGAALNRPDAKNKIAGIQCLIGVAETLDQGNCNNLQKMVLDTLSHIAARFNSLCDDLAVELEARPYEELAAMDDVTYSKPELEDIGKSRARH